VKRVTLYTDGACSGNPGPGGWGYVLIFGEHRREMSGYEPTTTNNRMELTAAIEGLSALKEPCEVDLYTDSSYMANGYLKDWIRSWQKRGWLKTDKNPVENQDLWKKLIEQTDRHRVRWNLVKGHADNVENNLCDKLATGAIKQNRER
jgi:ribonuclease HI